MRSAATSVSSVGIDGSFTLTSRQALRYGVGFASSTWTVVVGDSIHAQGVLVPEKAAIDTVTRTLRETRFGDPRLTLIDSVQFQEPDSALVPSPESGTIVDDTILVMADAQGPLLGGYSITTGRMMFLERIHEPMLHNLLRPD